MSTWFKVFASTCSMFWTKQIRSGIQLRGQFNRRCCLISFFFSCKVHYISNLYKKCRWVFISVNAFLKLIRVEWNLFSILFFRRHCNRTFWYPILNHWDIVFVHARIVKWLKSCNEVHEEKLNLDSLPDFRIRRENIEITRKNEKGHNLHFRSCWISE